MFQIVAFVSLPMAALIHQNQRGRRTKRRLAVRSNRPDHMPATVAFVFNLHLRRTPNNKRFLFFLIQRTDKALDEVKRDLRLITGPRRKNDFAVNLPIPLAHDRTQSEASR